MQMAPPEPTPVFVERRQGERRGLDSLRTEYQRSLLANTDDPDSPKPEFRWPLGVRPSRIALVVVAVVAGSVAAYLAMQREPAPVPAATMPVQQVTAPMLQILVAKTGIAIGQRLSPDAVEWRDWPEAAILPDYITSTATPQAIPDMAGSMVRSEFYAGEPIRPQKLAPATSGLLSAILDKGMRGVSVSVSAESASGGFVLPNDHVDVVLTHAGGAGQISETILRNVRILGINANLGATAGTGGTAGASDSGAKGFSDQAIATLELSPAQSEVIINATNLGKLSIVLRSTSDSADGNEDRPTNAAIRISSPFWSK